ncbi:outer membrane protein assembly factor [Moraxellaceae bacterium AER2_44_116]|nr:outer membrane protein assembly factor [Moraxellaceae bacterium]TQC97044.1 outer membrane protein assembly factor [Moraxellaceae bacterium AER2_44_116]
MRLWPSVFIISLWSISVLAIAKTEDDDFNLSENYVKKLTKDTSKDVTLRVEGVTGELKTNIEAYIGQLTEDDLNSWRETLLRLRKATREASEAVGYYQSEALFRREKNQVIVTVKANAPVIITDLNLNYDKQSEASNDIAFTALLESLPLKKGQIFHHGRYESIKSLVQNLALERGYFDGKWTTNKVSVTQPTQTAEINLNYDSGTRYRFGQVHFSHKQEGQPLPLKLSLLEKLAPFDEGEPYEAEKIIKFNRALIDSRYFTEVRVRADPDPSTENKEIPINVTLGADKPNQVDLGAGYATDIGARLSLAWRRPLLNENGHSIEITSEISQVRQSIDFRYGIPWRHPINDTLQIIAGFKREDIDNNTLIKNAILGIERQKKRDSGWQTNESIRWSRESYNKDNGEQGQSDLLLPGYGISRVRTKGSKTDPSSGDRQYYQVEFASPDLLSDADLLSLRAGWRLLRTYADRHQLGLRADIGSILSSDFESVPLNMRFYAGGDQSVRGYDYKSLSPRDSTGQVIGASNLVSGSVEYAFKLTPHWRLATFVDTGNAFDAVSESLKVGTGVGVRWISPVGPVRLDMAWGVSETSASPRIHFFMGPAL